MTVSISGQGKKPWPWSLSEIYIVNAATKETNEFSIHDWILMGILHCQLMNIISTPGDIMIQFSCNKTAVPRR